MSTHQHPPPTPWKPWGSDGIPSARSGPCCLQHRNIRTPDMGSWRQRRHGLARDFFHCRCFLACLDNSYYYVDIGSLCVSLFCWVCFMLLDAFGLLILPLFCNKWTTNQVIILAKAWTSCGPLKRSEIPKDSALPTTSSGQKQRDWQRLPFNSRKLSLIQQTKDGGLGICLFPSN